ncbi:PepSY-associated TM helix domain-containing protein [Sphingomonas sp. PB4P5]|uniref:PepSY-associated TM helix domain-containing protein n=1 Tax=Parasphingomonas puruogangriensis TaxID=3096155 RepID=UPI002FCA9B10
MKAIDKNVVRSALAAHSAIGLLAGALLYIVCLTGTLIVFDEEWQRIEQPRAPEMTAIAPGAVQAAIATVLASERGKKPTTHLFIELPSSALPRTTITTDHQARQIDAAGRVAMPHESAWAEFLLELHYALTLPATVGLAVVGLLGVMMLALSVTGVLALPRIFRDAFRLRARQSGGVALSDWHNRLAVWTLPFGLAIALTGAAIGLGALAAQGIATYTGEKTLQVFEPIFGGEHPADARAAPLADMATALRTMTARFPDTRPYFITLHDPGTAGQHIQIVAAHRHRLIYGDSYNFDARGRYQGKSGLSDGAIGQQVAASNYPLHFGNFGGLPVKIVYCVFGIALTVVTATGTWIWLGKRRRRGIVEPRLAGAWDGVVWGVPVALALTLAVRLTLGNAAPFAALFWIGSGISVAIGIARPRSR